jgi:hypothetical protein
MTSLATSVSMQVEAWMTGQTLVNEESVTSQAVSMADGLAVSSVEISPWSTGGTIRIQWPRSFHTRAVDWLAFRGSVTEESDLAFDSY